MKKARYFHKPRANVACVYERTFHLRRKHETSEVNRILFAASVHSARSTHKMLASCRCALASRLRFSHHCRPRDPKPIPVYNNPWESFINLLQQRNSATPIRMKWFTKHLKPKIENESEFYRNRSSLLGERKLVVSLKLSLKEISTFDPEINIIRGKRKRERNK